MSKFADKIVLLGETEGLQAAVIAMCLLGERIVNVITDKYPKVTLLILENWFREYFEIVTRNGLVLHKAAICRAAPLKSIREMLFRKVVNYTVGYVIYRRYPSPKILFFSMFLFRLGDLNRYNPAGKILSF
jgi:hypothetical protein